MSAKLGGEDVAERHELWNFIGGLTKHVALVTIANVLRAFGEVTINILGADLASDLSTRIWCEAGIKDGIEDLVTKLIWVAFVDRFKGKKEGETFFSRDPIQSKKH